VSKDFAIFDCFLVGIQFHCRFLANYKQEGGCLDYFVRLATTFLKDEENAPGNCFLVGNFAEYAPILKLIKLGLSLSLPIMHITQL